MKVVRTETLPAFRGPQAGQHLFIPIACSLDLFPGEAERLHQPLCRPTIFLGLIDHVVGGWLTWLTFASLQVRLPPPPRSSAGGTRCCMGHWASPTFRVICPRSGFNSGVAMDTIILGAHPSKSARVRQPTFVVLLPVKTQVGPVPRAPPKAIYGIESNYFGCATTRR